MKNILSQKGLQFYLETKLRYTSSTSFRIENINFLTIFSLPGFRITIFIEFEPITTQFHRFRLGKIL